MRASYRWVTARADLLFALLLLCALETEVATGSYIDQRLLTALVAIGTVMPLAVRRRFPFAVLVATFIGVGVLSIASPELDERSATFFVVVIFGIYSFGANSDGWQARSAAVVIPILIAYVVTHDGDSFHVGDILFGMFIVGGPYAAGAGLRLLRQRERRLTERAVELELEREENARAAVAEERARIARELHDVVAHAISVVVVQARGGRKVMDHDREETRRAFDAIERTGEQALGEMRRLLGMLREGDPTTVRAPQPSLARLDALAEAMRASGLPVEVSVEGDPVELAPGVDLAAYRIAQEALTNALKHAGPAVARVQVTYDADAVCIAVTDDGKGGDNGSCTGNGLVGVRERVAVVGGELTAGPLDGGGFGVSARLPYGSER